MLLAYYVEILESLGILSLKFEHENVLVTRVVPALDETELRSELYLEKVHEQRAQPCGTLFK